MNTGKGNPKEKKRKKAFLFQKRKSNPNSWTAIYKLLFWVQNNYFPALKLFWITSQVYFISLGSSKYWEYKRPIWRKKAFGRSLMLMCSLPLVGYQKLNPRLDIAKKKKKTDQHQGNKIILGYLHNSCILTGIASRYDLRFTVQFNYITVTCWILMLWRYFNMPFR